MPVKVAINGFGRIGRNIFRAGLHRNAIEFVAVNDLTDTKTLAHLIKYDSVLGRIDADIKAEADAISIGGKRLKVFAIKDPGELDWTSVGAQIVVESTGHFTDATKAAKHLRGSVKKVIISAPATNGSAPGTKSFRSGNTTFSFGVSRQDDRPGFGRATPFNNFGANRNFRDFNRD